MSGVPRITLTGDIGCKANGALPRSSLHVVAVNRRRSFHRRAAKMGHRGRMRRKQGSERWITKCLLFLSRRRDRANRKQTLSQSTIECCQPYVLKPKSFDCFPSSATSKPSAISPRLSISRMADARLGMRFKNRQLSISLSSSGVNMICRRSGRLITATVPSRAQ
jgi:hypothetical protein